MRAFTKAEATGLRYAREMNETENIKVNYKFMGVRTIYRLSQELQEAEIFSETYVPDDMGRYKSDLSLFHAENQSRADLAHKLTCLTE